MASISASVELYDRMSAPLMSIMNAMNMTISSMRDMQSTMGSDMDTSSLMLPHKQQIRHRQQLKQ